MVIIPTPTQSEGDGHRRVVALILFRITTIINKIIDNTHEMPLVLDFIAGAEFSHPLTGTLACEWISYSPIIEGEFWVPILVEKPWGLPNGSVIAQGDTCCLWVEGDRVWTRSKEIGRRILAGEEVSTESWRDLESHLASATHILSIDDL